MNPADQRFQDRLYKRIAALERALEDIKTSQRMGLDNFVFEESEILSASVYLDSGQDHSYRINFLADNPVLYVSELSFSLFINNDLDANYHWPDGAALADVSGLRPTDHSVSYDLYASDETGVGQKTYYVNLYNRSPFAKTIHMHAALVFPKGNIT